MTISFEREEELFAAALALPAVERSSYLQRACGDEHELRARVESLLDAFGMAERFMEKQPWAPPAEGLHTQRSATDEAAGDQIGDYKLVHEIGEGGGGVVYLAEQAVPVRRHVALKIIKLGMDTRAVIARFEAERQVLAMMDHPNIAKVLDAGATPSGRPYFVMELVRGIRITDYCDQGQLSPTERLTLFIQTCHAIQHAHQKGIIHRDIKPSNILVTLHDGIPVVKVIDFGIAKATQGRLTDQTLYTALEQFIGTPAYVSPEQTDPSGAEVDTRSDIYSLGVLLYELLTGCTPFDTTQLLEVAFDEMKHRIRQEEPPSPSKRLQTLSDAQMTITAQRRKTQAARLIKLVHGDLDWIVMRCLEKDRARRYATANELALDLQRYLRSEPIVARPPGLIYTFGKFARRHRVIFATGASIVAVLLIATAISAWLALRAIAAEKLAQTEAATRQEVINFLQNDLLAQASPAEEPDRDLKLRTVLDRAAEKIEGRFPNQPLVEAAVRETLGTTYDSLGEYENARKHYEVVLAIRSKQLGPEDQQTLKAMAYVGSVLMVEGKYAEAQSLSIKTVDLQRRVLGPKHEETLASISNLATIYHQQGKFDKAAKLFEQTLDIQKQVLGAENSETLITMNNLALSYRNQGKFAEAAALHEQEAKISERVLGAEHPDTLTSMSNLSVAHSELGRFADAQALVLKALGISSRVSGPEHPETLILRHNLATTYMERGQFAQAERLELQTLDMAKAVMGAEHPNTIKVLSVLAMIQRAQGKVAAAERSLAQTLEMSQRVLGPDHPVSVVIMSNLAWAYEDGRKFTDARSLLTRTVAMSKDAFGPEHPYTLRFSDQLAGVLLELGEFAEAERLLVRSIAPRATTAPRHWRTYAAQSQLGAALTGLERFSEAEDLLISAYRGLQEQAATIPAPNKSALDASGERIAQLYAARGNAAQAQEWRRKLSSSHASGDGQ